MVTELVSIDVRTIYEMRQLGASLQQIADQIGRTKERVRQILVKNYGTTKRTLLSSEQLCAELDLPRKRIIELYQNRVITPAMEWRTGNHHYLLWTPATVQQINEYYGTHRLCKICLGPVPKGRRVYCSSICHQEGQKYRYKDLESKKRRLLSIKRCRERRKLLAQNQRPVRPVTEREYSVV